MNHLLRFKLLSWPIAHFPFSSPLLSTCSQINTVKCKQNSTNNTKKLYAKIPKKSAALAVMHTLSVTHTFTHSHTLSQSHTLSHTHTLMLKDAHLVGQCRLALLQPPLAAVVAELAGQLAQRHGRGGGHEVKCLQAVVQFVQCRERCCCCRRRCRCRCHCRLIVALTRIDVDVDQLIGQRILIIRIVGGS